MIQRARHLRFMKRGLVFVESPFEVMANKVVVTRRYNNDLLPGEPHLCVEIGVARRPSQSDLSALLCAEVTDRFGTIGGGLGYLIQRGETVVVPVPILILHLPVYTYTVKDFVLHGNEYSLPSLFTNRSSDGETLYAKLYAREVWRHRRGPHDTPPARTRKRR